MFLLLAAPAAASDVDFYRGLHWYQAASDQEIRLLGIYPATLPGDLETGEVKLLVPEDPLTRHGEVLAHVMVYEGETATWLQDRLVRDGRAIVMPIYERDGVRLQALLAAEDQARSARAGLWQKSPVVCSYQAKSAFDGFAIIQGRITQAAEVGGNIYLNFGEDYREDFTIKISRSVFRTLPEAVQAKITLLTDRQEPDSMVEARGWVFYSGGPMIEVKTPAQIRFLENTNPLTEKRCAS